MKNYKYTLTDDKLYTGVFDYFHRPNPRLSDREFNAKKLVFYGFSDNGQLLITIKGGNLTVHKGYSWDGCSPKIKLLGRFIGTPDGFFWCKDATKEASCIHDALFQFHEQINRKYGLVILTRKRVDGFFYRFLKAKKFFLKRTYYAFVRVFGGFYWKQDC